MKTISRTLTFILAAQLILSQQTVQAAPKTSFALVKGLSAELSVRPETFYAEEELKVPAIIEENQVTSEVIQEIKTKLKDKSYSLAEIKESIQRELLIEEQNKLIELKQLLSNASPEKLDVFFNRAMADGVYNPELRYNYESAYNQFEKIEVLMQMLSSDLSLIRSQNARQLGLMEREDILKHIEMTGSLLSTKNGKVKKILIIILTVAAVGLVTWGIVSATKTRFEKKKKKTNEEYDRKEGEAEAEHKQRVKTLEETFAERERLREEGYVWQVCSTKTTQKTASCSYDSNSYAGQEVCVTHCLKHPATGQEAGHIESCTSSFIPNNCFIKNPTAAGYDDGYASGYDRGYSSEYDRAYSSAYSSAYDSAYNWAYSSAYSSAYNRGYDSGYSAGVSDATTSESSVPMAPMKSRLLNDDRAAGYKKGYSEGYAYGLQLKVGFNF